MQEHGVALAAEEAHEEPDTGGASSSQTACKAVPPGLQAQRSWEHAKWMGHTSNAILTAIAIVSAYQEPTRNVALAAFDISRAERNPPVMLRSRRKPEFRSLLR